MVLVPNERLAGTAGDARIRESAGAESRKGSAYGAHGPEARYPGRSWSRTGSTAGRCGCRTLLRRREDRLGAGSARLEQPVGVTEQSNKGDERRYTAQACGQPRREQHGEASFHADPAERRIEWGSAGGYRGWMSVAPDGDGSRLTLFLETRHSSERDHDISATLDAIRMLVESEV
jgi:hypothetical protein